MFQAASFVYIIGSMWQADHGVASEIAISFYRRLAQGREAGEDVFYNPEGGMTVVAKAVHLAVLEARGEDMENPLSWENFVHFGP